MRVASAKLPHAARLYENTRKHPYGATALALVLLSPHRERTDLEFLGVFIDFWGKRALHLGLLFLCRSLESERVDCVNIKIVL